MAQLPTTAKKEPLLNGMKQEIEKIPDYLTEQNLSFREMIVNKIQSKMRTVTTKHVEELRKIAILIYKIMIIQIYHAQWSTYFKLSTASIYPQTIKQLVVQQQLKLKNKSNENEYYLEFVNQQLSELDHQLKQYQIELNLKANNFHGYTLSIQNHIEKYIEQHLQSFRIPIEHEIELLHYDYHIQMLKLEFLKQHPNQYQVC